MLSMQIPFMVLNVMVGLSFQQEYSEVSFSNSGGIARASSSFGGFSPSQAFERAVYIPENRDDRFWHSAFNRPAPSTFPQSLWYEFPEKIRVVKYSFRSRRWGDWLISADGPSQYVFWASNSEDCSDETQRKELHKDNSGTQFDRQNTPKVMTITNHKFYRCYGFKVTDVPGRDRMTRWNNVGDKFVTISEVRFYEIPDSNTVHKCEHQGNLNIECSFGSTIKVFHANFGRTSLEDCPAKPGFAPPAGSPWPTDCVSPTSTQEVKNRCQGKSRCSVKPSIGIFGNPCGRTWKYLQVTYVCE